MQEKRWLSLPNLIALGAGLDLFLLAWGNFWCLVTLQPLALLPGILCHLSKGQHRRGFAAEAERLRCACLLARC